MLRFFPSLLESEPLGLLEYITVPASQSYTTLRLSLKMKILISASPVPATWHAPVNLPVQRFLQRRVFCWARGLGAPMECAVFCWEDHFISLFIFHMWENNCILPFKRDESGKKRYHFAPREHFFSLRLLEGWQSVNWYTMCPQKTLSFNKPETEKEFSVRN